MENEQKKWATDEDVWVMPEWMEKYMKCLSCTPDKAEIEKRYNDVKHYEYLNTEIALLYVLYDEKIIK